MLAQEEYIECPQVSDRVVNPRIVGQQAASRSGVHLDAGVQPGQLGDVGIGERARLRALWRHQQPSRVQLGLQARHRLRVLAQQEHCARGLRFKVVQLQARQCLCLLGMTRCVTVGKV